MNYDILTIIFWSITYVFLVIFMTITKKIFMPLIALVLNFGWEINALVIDVCDFAFSYVFLGHIAWIALDLVIFVLSFVYSNNRTKLFLILSLMFSVFILLILFNHHLALISCFIIDLIMAILFVFKILYDKYKIIFLHIYALIIGILKLLGDLFAWLYYKSFDSMIFMIGIEVLIANGIYIIICIYKLIRYKNYEDLI